MRGTRLDVPVGAGEASGCPGLPLEAQDGGMGRCCKVWLGVLHLESVWFLPPDAEMTGRTMKERLAATTACSSSLESCKLLFIIVYEALNTD